MLPKGRLSTPTTAKLEAIPDGVAGTKATLQLMRRIVRDYKKSMPVRLTAMRIVESAGPKQWVQEARNIQQFVRDRIRYLKDVRGVETIQTPDKTLELRQGDCDDKSILTASLLESIGHPTRFVAVSFMPGIYSHVLVETLIGNKWVPVETTVENKTLGWFPPHVLKSLRVHN